MRTLTRTFHIGFSHGWRIELTKALQDEKSTKEGLSSSLYAAKEEIASLISTNKEFSKSKEEDHRITLSDLGEELLSKDVKI